MKNFYSVHHIRNTAYLFFLLAIIFPIAAHAQWEADRRLSVSDSGAKLNENMGQCLAVSGDSIHVIWYENTTTGGAVFYVHSFDAGTTWSIPQRLSAIPSSADLPSIAVNGPFVHVAWRDVSGSQNINDYTRSTDGGLTWSPIISLGVWYWWPSITTNGAEVFLALNDSHTNNTEVYCRRSLDNGATWDTATHQISNAIGRSEDPSITAANNFVHLAWNDNRTGLMETWYRRSTDNGVSWGAETQLTNSAVFAYCPFVNAIGSDVDLVWGDRRTGNYEIWIRHSSDYGSTWSAETRLSQSNGANSVYPILARDGANMHLVWWTMNAPISYLHSSDGGATWDSAAHLVTNTAAQSNPFMKISGTALHLIWMDSRNGNTCIYYKRNLTGNSQTVVTQLAAPALTSPANAAANLPSSDTLAWSGVAGATHFELQLSTQQNFSSTLIDDTTQVALVRPVSGLADSTNYFWRVRGISGSVISAWSQVWSFTTAAPLVAPLPTVPPNNAVQVATTDSLVWSPAPGAVAYDVQISIQQNFSSTVLNETDSVFHRALPVLMPLTKYFWRVRSIESTRTSAWSQTWSFTTQAAAGVNEIKLSPNDFQIISIAPNPFHDATTITIASQSPAIVSLQIVDMLGRILAEPLHNSMVAGTQSVGWLPTDPASGMYMVKIISNGIISSQRVMRLR